jgi:hypothetical protein
MSLYYVIYQSGVDSYLEGAIEKSSLSITIRSRSNRNRRTLSESATGFSRNRTTLRDRHLG